MRIREGRFPEDSAAAERFVAGSNDYESAFEPDRLPGAEIAAAYVGELLKKAREKNGRVFIAEDNGGSALGWAVCHEAFNAIFVRLDERNFGNISELYVDEAMRGRGVGQSLIAACEDHFRSQGLKVAMIGVLEKNELAKRSYARAGYHGYSRELRKYL